MKNFTKMVCKRCGSEVEKSDNPEYAFQCFECDEDLYTFEVEERPKKQKEEKEMKMDYHLESRLSNIAFRFEQLEAELKTIPGIWDFIIKNYHGHPLTNIDEFVEDVKNNRVITE